MGRWQRAVGVFVLGVAVLGSALLVLGVALTLTAEPQPTDHSLIVGTWQLMYNTEAPSGGTLLAAVGIGLVCAAGVGGMERRIANRSRRGYNPVRQPLAPRVVMTRTRGVFHGPITVTVLIPAHNEQSCIGATLRSLFDQSVVPDRIIVVADNCTDDTELIARAAGAEVFSTVDNVHKKGGALNQALRELLPQQGHNDLVLVMDADTTIHSEFVRAGVQRMTNDRALMAVGGLFYGEEGEGLLGQFQRNEYHRYQRDILRRRGRPFVLTGTATLFRSVALQQVAAARGRWLPGISGDVYDTAALTEDNELTLALKSMGALMVSPQECTVVTEVMPTWRALWAQRLRWQRGALENLGAYGFRPSTFRYWVQQLGIGYGVIALAGYLLLMLVMAVSLNSWVWFPFWVGIGLVFVLERVVTVWRGGWRARLLAATIFPELIYAMFLDLVYLKGVLDISMRRSAQWRHLVPSTRGGRLEVSK